MEENDITVKEMKVSSDKTEYFTTNTSKSKFFM